MTKVIVMEDATGANTKAYIGFSVTILFFGPIVPLFRGHLIGFAGMIASYLAVGVFIIGAMPDANDAILRLLGFVLNLVFAFTYNSWHRGWLVGRGYKPVSIATEVDRKPRFVSEMEALKGKSPASGEQGNVPVAYLDADTGTVAQLEKIASLRNSGVIDEDEFIALKNDVLKK